MIAGCLALAMVARRAPGGPWWTGVTAVAVLPLAVYIVSRTAGLPNGEDDMGAWGEASGIASLVFEAFTTIVAARASMLLTGSREPVRRPAARRAEPVRDY